ncbi:hypothetical protein ACFO9Q_04540 [Paenibacillus sp. GCM10023252]|uniref:hypothetical protein n=1 Tax=Paenibacillus sp. GCM10023252 TaxID=3252649 RepID=UPI0036216EDF
MTTNIAIHLYQDWLRTVREIFQGSGHPLPEDLTDEQIGLAYYLQTASSEEEARALQQANQDRLHHLQQTLLDNFEGVVLPDIRSRTDYEGDQFSFKWVYLPQGEHLIEEHSAYRIPL